MRQSRRAAWVLAATLFFLAGMASADVVDFDFDWRFSRGDFATAMMPAFDDSAWQRVDVPHDWSAEGPFLAEYASGSGYAPGGIGWYRKHFKLDAANRGKLVVIDFDGVYHDSEVWINGHFLGRRPCGYSSFQYDLTRHVRFGDDENVIAVRVDHTKFADSRWYTGSGIYRHVRLYITDKLHVGLWGVYVTTPEVKNDSATIRVETVVCNDHDRAVSLSLDASVVAPDGKAVASLRQSASMDAGAEQTFVSQIRIADPELWSLESPSMYTLRSVLKAGEQVVQEVSTPFGIRAIAFDPDKGFFLNGRALKLKGVCLHHDAGCLGAAVPDKVLERRLRSMKDLGANAIRTSHNPPAPELLDLCDRLGLLVKNEMFDEFTPPKNKWVEGWNAGQPSKFGYGEVFEQWSVRDMEDLVRRDRNHPCVVMWSIGNEIDYPNDPFSHPALGNNYRREHPPAEDLVKHARPLIEAVRKWDRTRPVTAALASIPMSNAVGLAQLLDVVGYNYQEQHYEADHRTYPNRFIFGSENSDSYNAWLAVRDNEYVAGQFLWTGIDYLGEARRWPNRANGSGLLDLCGFKKPLAWFRQSLWRDEPMVYICVSPRLGRRWRGMFGADHWNWAKDAHLTVSGCTNCQEVTLILNGKPLETKPISEASDGILTWEIPFERGTLKAVGRNDGRDVCEFTLCTASDAKRIVLLPDTTELKADGKDICHIEFAIVDEDGVCVPSADHEITFDVGGPGRIIGIENGDLSSIEAPQDNVHRAYRGRGLAILRAGREAGTLRITAQAQGLDEATIEIETRAKQRPR